MTSLSIGLEGGLMLALAIPFRIFVPHCIPSEVIGTEADPTPLFTNGFFVGAADGGGGAAVDDMVDRSSCVGV